MGNLRILAAVLAAALLSSWLTAFLLGRQAPPAPPSPAAAHPDLAELNLRLQELTRALQLRAAAGPAADAATTGERLPVADDATLSEVRSTLQEIRGLVGRPADPRNQGSQLALAAARNVDTRWQEVQALRERFQLDRTGTRQAMFFQTAEMILQRFGRPTSMTVRESGALRWTYQDRTGERTVTTSFEFMDGYVIGVN